MIDLEKIKSLGRESEVILLRPHELEASEDEGDFDFLDTEGALAGKVEELFGQPLVLIERQYVHQRFYEWGQVDILPSLEWNGCKYADAKLVIQEAILDADGVRRPRLGHDGLISWVTSLLWGGFVKKKYSGIIERAAREDGEVMRDGLKWAFGSLWAEEMMTWALGGRSDESACHAKTIRRALKWHSFRRELGGNLVSRAKHWKCELQHHYNPKLPMISFLGPDGSGKSSVIEGLCKRLDQMGLQQKMMHWRPYGLTGREELGIPVSNPHGDPPRGRLTSIAKLWYLFFDWWLASLTVIRHARAKTSVVISDRYFDDLLVDPIRYRYGAGQGFARTIFRFFPKPDLVFVLTGAPEVIFPRKKEVPLDELRSQVIRYRSLASRFGKRACIVNVEKSIEKVVDSVFDHLKSFLLEPWLEKGGAGLDNDRPEIRIAQYVPHYPSVEGISSYIRGLSKAMNEISPGSCPVITFRTELSNVSGEEELLHYPHSSWNQMSIPKLLLRDLKSNRHQVDGLVMHGTYHPKIGVIRKKLDRMGIPYMFVPHDPYVPDLTRHHGIRKWFFWHLYEKHTIRGARAVQLLSASHERPLRDRGFEVPVEVIPNGCELETLQHLPKNAHEPGRNKRCRIQFIGRMDRNHKGLDLLIKGFHAFLQDDLSDGVDLILTGSDWEDREELEDLAKELGLSERVVFTGPRSEHSLVILSEADLVVLPSRFDGFGLCIVEAMLAKRPVMVSNKAGVSEHVGKAGGGWLVDPTVESIRAGLLEAVSIRDKWPEMGRSNHEYVVNNLTWKQAAEKTLAMYQKHF